MSNSQQPFGETNELAKFRNRAAAERTLTSWIQNCLGLIAFGIGFERILNALMLSFPNNDLLINLKIVEIVGLTTIALGIFLLILAIIQYRMQIQFLSNKKYLNKPFSLINQVMIVGSVILFGLVALMAVFIVSVH